MLRSLIVATTVALSPVAATASPLDAFSEVFVFGDSLSDPGNTFNDLFGAPVSPIPGIYDNGQLTDGDTWATQLGADFASGTNFAFAGATAALSGAYPITLPDGSIVLYNAPDLAEQVVLFQTAKTDGTVTPGANPLAALWIGANDLRDAFDAPDPEAAVTAAIAAASAEIVAQTQILLAEGISKVVVMGVPDLGMIPEVVNDPFGAPEAVTATSVAFNDTLRTALAAALPSGVQYFDTFGLFREVAEDPAGFGFTNMTQPCVYAVLGGFIQDCDGYFFYDEVHPTEAAHALIAESFVTAVAPIPLPAGGVLLVTGLGGMMVLGRRRGRA